MSLRALRFIVFTRFASSFEERFEDDLAGVGSGDGLGWQFELIPSRLGCSSIRECPGEVVLAVLVPQGRIATSGMSSYSVPGLGPKQVSLMT